MTQPNLIRRVIRSGWFLAVITMINTAMLVWSLYLHYSADVVVHGIPLKNCTSVSQPDRMIWTCGQEQP